MDALVSVILSTYNETAPMITQSVNSILAQTYRRLELILINDNPQREDLHGLLQGLAENDERIVYVRHAENKGLVDSLNEGIEKAKGEYIARMDADDVAHPDRLEKQKAFLEERGCDLVGCPVEKIDEEGTPLGKLAVPVSHEAIVKFMPYGSCVLHPTWFVKKSAYERMGGYRHVDACEDYDFLFRAIREGLILGNVPEALLYYRVRAEGVSVSSAIKQKLSAAFLVRHRKDAQTVSELAVREYCASARYQKDAKKLSAVENAKTTLKHGGLGARLGAGLHLVANPYFYGQIRDKIKRRQREKYAR